MKRFCFVAQAGRRADDRGLCPRSWGESSLTFARAIFADDADDDLAPIEAGEVTDAPMAPGGD